MIKLKTLLESPDYIKVDDTGYSFESSEFFATYSHFEAHIFYNNKINKAKFSVIGTGDWKFFSPKRSVLSQRLSFITKDSLNPKFGVPTHQEVQAATINVLKLNMETDSLYSLIDGRIFHVDGQYYMTNWEKYTEVKKYKNSIDEIIDTLKIDRNKLFIELPPNKGEDFRYGPKDMEAEEPAPSSDSSGKTRETEVTSNVGQFLPYNKYFKISSSDASRFVELQRKMHQSPEIKAAVLKTVAEKTPNRMQALADKLGIPMAKLKTMLKQGD